MVKILVGVADNYPPDIQAMMMAKYSRSYASIEDRLPDSKESEEQHRENLARFYIGYGHKSVGQLGTTTIWLEGVSQLAAKAIENTPLYNGQESSTRYIDFANQPMVSSDKEITYWQEQFRSFYVKAVPLVISKLKNDFPFDLNCGEYLEKDNLNEEEQKIFYEAQRSKKLITWENTIKARSFDICRGLLPAGCTTNVAFSGTFDNINDHFGEMLFHPCQEMRDIASEVLKGLREKYPYASMDTEELTRRNSFVTDDFFYQDLKEIPAEPQVCYIKTSLFKYDEKLKERTKFSKINRLNASNTKFYFYGALDFGSFRDLHRHRNGIIGMPVFDVKNGFHDFYIDSLPSDLQTDLRGLIIDYEKWYDGATYLSQFDKQYSTPMGFKVPIQYSCDINQALYILELRSGKTVHQTLRFLIQEWVKCFKNVFEENSGEITIHADMDLDNFTLRRGNQTFSV